MKKRIEFNYVAKPGDVMASSNFFLNRQCVSVPEVHRKHMLRDGVTILSLQNCSAMHWWRKVFAPNVDKAESYINLDLLKRNCDVLGKFIVSYQ